MLAFDEEISTAIEIGAKGTVLDGNLRYNFAVFYQEFEDHQVTQAGAEALDTPLGDLNTLFLNQLVNVPGKPHTDRHVYHLYVIRVKDREAMLPVLREKGVGVGVHYPVALHMQGAYRRLGFGEGSEIRTPMSIAVIGGLVVSTLLTLIGTLRTVQEGSLQVLGQELRDAPRAQMVALRRDLGFIFQAHNLFDSLTALQNVRIDADGLVFDLAVGQDAPQPGFADNLIVEAFIERSVGGADGATRATVSLSYTGRAAPLSGLGLLPVERQRIRPSLHHPHPLQRSEGRQHAEAQDGRGGREP